MNTTKRFFASLAAFVLVASTVAGLTGCGDDSGTTDSAVVRDMTGSGTLDFTVVDMTVPGADLSGDMAVLPDLGFDPQRNCYPAPGDVHVEIINACIQAGQQKVNKTPKAQYLDGGCCPPLP